MADPDLVEAEILYQGLRLSSEGKRLIVFSPVDDITNTSNFSISKEKDWRAFSSFTPGSALLAKVRLGDGDNIASLVMKASWIRLHSNAADRLRWSTEHRLAESEHQRSRLGKAEVSELHKLLLPIRGIYQSTIGWKRTALIAEIVRYICT